MKLCGIDEAGRGPCIGPMVLAGIVIKDYDEPRLRELGVKDSKLLTPIQREKLFVQIKDVVEDYNIIIVPPNEIDDAVNGIGGLNLNWLEGEKSAELINALHPDKAILDCPSNNISAYTSYVKERLNLDVELVVEHKADMNHLVVGAASILAKVTRDAEIASIRSTYGNIGSGYPSDPVTKKFLLENWNKHPKIFRKSWSSYKNVMRDSAQRKLI